MRSATCQFQIVSFGKFGFLDGCRLFIHNAPQFFGESIRLLAASASAVETVFVVVSDAVDASNPCNFLNSFCHDVLLLGKLLFASFNNNIVKNFHLLKSKGTLLFTAEFLVFS